LDPNGLPLIVSSNSEPVVVVDGLRVTRGRAEILRGLSFEVAASSVTGLIGPSGCGKTTLMRVIVGVQLLTAGDVSVLDLPAGSPNLRGQIGYAAQSPAIYADLTARENLQYFAAASRTSSSDIERVVGATDMAGYADQLVASLSGGERSRVSLAVALLGSPPLLILDEPTVGLDPVLRRDLWSLFHQLSAEGTTLLISSHVMDEADRCDQLLLMRDGRLLAQDSPEDLRRRTGARDLESAFLTLVEEEPLKR
jgi:ABC-2 type transport system ATP-binding protein